jgi:hypothetical protein
MICSPIVLRMGVSAIFFQWLPYFGAIGFLRRTLY